MRKGLAQSRYFSNATFIHSQSSSRETEAKKGKWFLVSDNLAPRIQSLAHWFFQQARLSTCSLQNVLQSLFFSCPPPQPPTPSLRPVSTKQDVSSDALRLPPPSLLGRNPSSPLFGFICAGSCDLFRQPVKLQQQVLSAHKQQVHLPEATPSLCQSGSRCACSPEEDCY